MTTPARGSSGLDPFRTKITFTMYEPKPSSVSREDGVIRTQVKKLVEDLFGGEKAYKALPVLNFSTRENWTGVSRPSWFPSGLAIDMIKPQDMTAPIMRGNDFAGREFFVINSSGSKKKEAIQAFFEFDPKSQLEWVSGADGIVPGYREFIRFNGSLVEIIPEVYEQIKEAIEEIQARQAKPG